MSTDRVRVRWAGRRQMIAWDERGHATVMDAPAGHSGEGTGARPIDVFLQALGACTAMDVVSIAAKKRQAIDDYRIHLRGDQRDEYPQVYTAIDVVHEVTGVDISEAAIRRSIELSATKYCPVSAMISAGATVVHHRYRIHSTGANPYDAEGEVIATGPYARPDVMVDQR